VNVKEAVAEMMTTPVEELILFAAAFYVCSDEKQFTLEDGNEPALRAFIDRMEEVYDEAEAALGLDD
jgi:hypothetical protein